MTLRLDNEALRVADLSAKLFEGDVSGLFELKNNAGTGLFSGQLKLAGADIASVLGDVGLTGRADISTALSATGKSVGGLVSTLSGSGTAAFNSLVVDGVNTSAFPEFIARADLAGKDINAATTAGFAPGIASSGSFAADAGEVAFTVAAGVLRAPPMELKNSAATIETNLQSDLNSGTVTVRGTIAYDPGQEALVGADPALRFTLEGPIGAATRSFDSEPLAQFLTQRALENEQARVEGMQDALLERQRLRREARYYAALQQEHDLSVAEARKAAEAEAEAKRKAEEEARLRSRGRGAGAADRGRGGARGGRGKGEARGRGTRADRRRGSGSPGGRGGQAGSGGCRQGGGRGKGPARGGSARCARPRTARSSKPTLPRAAAEDAAKAEADARARLEAEERARQEAARRAADEAARAAQAERDRREAQNAAPAPLLDFTPEFTPTPPRELTNPDTSRPQPKPDGFRDMLNGDP